ncbi:hypothetical protein ONZ43_g6169 [Nemania bipapillata]|uniref:Uncharacterized protein n=1 Tax=Nemania bipapillata TaxID=110536 RepID=A0ACC2I2U0_9PEZI|nr:hypothetical protein ONZ43_g6169 [Nemania bipapillata]
MSLQPGLLDFNFPCANSGFGQIADLYPAQQGLSDFPSLWTDDGYWRTAGLQPTQLPEQDAQDGTLLQPGSIGPSQTREFLGGDVSVGGDLDIQLDGVLDMDFEMDFGSVV